MKKYYLLVFLLSFFLSACRAEFLAADQLPWVGDAPILYKDNFSSRTGGWITHEDRLSFSGYESGGFRLWADVPNYQVWSVPKLNFRNTYVYAQATKMGGPDDNIFGVLCRYQDEANFYAFMISSDGYYGIFKNLGGVQNLVDQPYMQFSESIRRGEATNKILAVCQSDQFILFVNDTRLLQVQDASLTYGDVGLIVGNFSEPGVDILFDDFIVVRP